MLATELLQAKRQPQQTKEDQKQTTDKEPISFWKKKFCTPPDIKPPNLETDLTSQKYFTSPSNSGLSSTSYNDKQNSIEYIPSFPFIPPHSFTTLPSQSFEDRYRGLYDFNTYNRLNNDKITPTTKNLEHPLESKPSNPSQMPQTPLPSVSIKTEIASTDDPYSEYSHNASNNCNKTTNNSKYPNDIARHNSGSSGSSGSNFISPNFVKSEIMSPNDHLKNYSRQNRLENNSFPHLPSALLPASSSSFDSLKKMMQRFGSTDQRNPIMENSNYQYYHLQQQQQQHMQQQFYQQKQLQQQYLSQMRQVPALGWSGMQSPPSTSSSALPSLISIHNEPPMKSSKLEPVNYSNEPDDHVLLNKVSKVDKERFNSSSNDETNYEQETEKLFPCRNCSFIGSSKDDFEQHCREHFKFSCNMCNYKSKSEGRLKRHLKHSHNTEDKKEDNDDNINDQTVSSNEKLNDSNEDEHLIKFNLSSPEHHSQQQQNYLVKEENKQPSPIKPAPVNPTNKKPVKARPCKICGHITYTKNETYQHRITHFPNMFRCEMPGCQFATQHRHHFLYHIKGHNGEKQYKCSKCNYRCLTRSMLVSHEKCHSYVYRYRCSCCKFSAKHAHALTVHIEKWNHKAAPVLRPDGSLPVNDPSSNFENFVRKGRKQNPTTKQTREKTFSSVKTGKKDLSKYSLNDFNNGRFSINAPNSPGKFQFPDLLLLQQQQQQMQDKYLNSQINQQQPHVNGTELPFNYQAWFAELQNRGRQMLAEGLGRSSNSNGPFMPQLPFNFNLFQSMAFNKNPYGTCKCNACGESFSNVLLLMNHVMSEGCPTTRKTTHENGDDESFEGSDNEGVQVEDDDDDDDGGEDTDKYTENNDNRDISEDERNVNLKSIGNDVDSYKDSNVLDLTSKPKQTNTNNDNYSESSSIPQVKDKTRKLSSDFANEIQEESNNVSNNLSRKSRRKGIAHKLDVNKSMETSFDKPDNDNNEFESNESKNQTNNVGPTAEESCGKGSLNIKTNSQENIPKFKHFYGDEICDKFTNASVETKPLRSKETPVNNSTDSTNVSPIVFKHSPQRQGSTFEIDAQSRYHCPHCRIIFGDSRVYDIHMEFHDPVNPFMCSLCGRESKDGRDFFLHVAQFEHKLKTDW